ncbi:methylmalonyl-CoA epimerase [Actinocatenispora rupis]|uniref:Methylmalonyl-CoA epimerase n=1 Tax=Actinocatenispora rupis TaxID=519421 RepID=A0A8J3NCZ6_9ACTN|nr:methylmalonyl-CoA epimerase [Actinocatenispora rupis]GID14526.1 methylmalonyl-CoA epimerase [Actinocatenispora rupis]
MPSPDESRRATHLTTGLRVLRVDHVGLAVPDLDTAVAYWTDTFGMTCVHTETNPDQGVREAMLRAGDGETMLQLIAPLGPDSTIARFLDTRGPGLQQLAYTVADVVAAADTLRARGVRLLYDEPRTGTGGSLINFVHPKDAGGVLVELVQPPAPDRT